jgi:uncharacterized cupredoxin-like copper-binding protein
MRRLLLLPGSGLLLVVAGCGSHNSHGSTHTHATSSQGASPAVPLSTGTATTPVAGAQTLTVELDDYTVKLDKTTVGAGPVRLVVRNAGQRGHELQVYPMDAVSGSGHGTHMGSGGVVQGAVGFLQLIPVGQTMELDVVLPAGKWEVACHLTDSENGKSFDHYDKGMKTALTAGP